jgi:hypothetical protein
MGVCLIVCDIVTSTMRQPRTKLGCCIKEKSLYNVKQQYGGCVTIFFSFRLDDGN